MKLWLGTVALLVIATVLAVGGYWLVSRSPSSAAPACAKGNWGCVTTAK